MPGVGVTCLDDIQLVPSGFSKITGGQCFPGTKRSGVQCRLFLFNHHGRQNKMNQGFQQPVEAFFLENLISILPPFPAPKCWQIKITDFMRMFISESTDMGRKSWFLFDLKWIYLYAQILNPIVIPLFSLTPPQHPKTSWLALFKLFEVWLGQA